MPQGRGAKGKHTSKRHRRSGRQKAFKGLITSKERQDQAEAGALAHVRRVDEARKQKQAEVAEVKPKKKSIFDR